MTEPVPTYPTPTSGTGTGRAEATAELWDEAAGALTAVSIVLLLVYLVVVLAAHATGNPVLEVAAVVLATWALLALLATHVADTEGRSVLWRLLRRLGGGGGRR